MKEYADYIDDLTKIADDFIRRYEETAQDDGGDKLYEHLSSRIKSVESMQEKCNKIGVELTAYNALKVVHDAIGVRVICLFIDDIMKNVKKIREMDGITIVKEKDYISATKPNGYRSYHMLLEVESNVPDAAGNDPGRYFIEVQLRTIAMDTWAALEHELRYKKDIKNSAIIAEELKRCAGELASCDISMQTLKDMIRGS